MQIPAQRGLFLKVEKCTMTAYFSSVIRKCKQPRMARVKSEIWEGVSIIEII